MANARPVAIAEQFAPQAVQFVFVIDPPEGVVNTLRYILRYRVESPLPCTWGINNRLLNYLIRPYNVANVAMAIRDFITVAIKTRVYSPEILLELQRTLPFLKCSIENFSVDTWRSQLLRPPLFSKGTEIVLPSDFPQTSARRFDSIPSHDLPKVFVAFTPPDGNENYPPHPTHLHGDAGFLKFLQERTVPGDTRVTAGGRIVPVELTENSYSHGQHQSFAAEQASNGIMPTFFPVGTPGTLDMTFFPAASIQYANGSFEAARQNNTLTSGVSVGMLSPDLQGLPPVVMDPSQPVWWPEWSQVNDQHFVWTNNHAPFVMDPSMATKPWALPIQMNEIPNQLSYQQFLLKKFALKNELTMLQSPFWTSGDFSKDQIQRIHQETATIEKELEELHARWERSERVLHGEIENMLPPGRILPLPSGVGPDLLVPRSSQQGRHAGSQAGGQLGASSDSNIRLPPLRTLHSNQGMPIGSTIGSRPEQKRKNRVHFEDDLVTKDQTGTNVDKHEPNLEDSEGEKQENRAKRAKPRATSEKFPGPIPSMKSQATLFSQNEVVTQSTGGRDNSSIGPRAHSALSSLQSSGQLRSVSMGGEDQGEERSREVEMRFKANEAEILRKINDRQNQSSFLGRLNQDPRYSPLFQEEDFAAAVRMEANKHTPRVPFENLYASAAASAGQPPRDMRTLAVGSKTPASAVTNVTTANGEMHFPRLGATVDASTNARFAQGLTGTSGLAPVSSDIQAGSMRPRADSRAEEVNKLFANLRREEHKEVTAYRKTNRR